MRTTYYYQLVADNVRRYKGAPRPLPLAGPAKTIDIAGGFEQWRDVQPEYAGHAGITAPRDHAGVYGTHYSDSSGRNNLVAMKVARDERNFYFYVRTAEPIVPSARLPPDRGSSSIQTQTRGPAGRATITSSITSRAGWRAMRAAGNGRK